MSLACNELGEIEGEPPIVDMTRPVPIAKLFAEFKELRPPIIDGILRRGEVANVIASPKMGKSFLAGGLAWSVSTGRSWLGFNTTQGRVLVIDNELHPETLASRLWRIAVAMEIEDATAVDTLDVLSLRGRQCDIHELDIHLDSYSNYSLIVVDALYRTLPEKTSENDNAQMMAVYNRLDAYAAKTQAAIVVVHHSSKGDQSEKSLTDMGAGAGAISRAADAHLAIRPHEQKDFAVLEAVTRSFKSPEPMTIGWEYPLWIASTLEPEVKKRKPPRAETQEADDRKAKSEILELFTTSSKPMRQQKLIELSTFSVNKTLRILNILAKNKTVKRLQRTKPGTKKPIVYWKLLPAVLPAD
jgi:hypothetical protein